MKNENLSDNSTDIQKYNIIKKYEKRPNFLKSVYLADFDTNYYINNTGNYAIRTKPLIIRYRNYKIEEMIEYQTETVLLYVPFDNEEIDILNRNKNLQKYDENLTK